MVIFVPKQNIDYLAKKQMPQNNSLITTLLRQIRRRSKKVLFLLRNGPPTCLDKKMQDAKTR